MYHNTKIIDLMFKKLPNLTFQRKMWYKTNKRQVKALYRLLNDQIFNNQLPEPELVIKSRLRNAWGECIAMDFLPKPHKSRCTIVLSNRYYCIQWLIMTLAHEMVHQYQWDVYSVKREKKGLEPIISHGPSFFAWKKKLKRHGIPLKISNDHKRWFKTQHLFKC